HIVAMSEFDPKPGHLRHFIAPTNFSNK
ncbi:MAG: hypothetical protein JWO81_111, partial [Alphaproteobacteria bacterium]|nr:hypothetical protein [Alphaproteobacteria bacterium]